MAEVSLDRAYAEKLDAADPLAGYRERILQTSCQYDGGMLAPDSQGCAFYYLLFQTTQFVPNGTISSTAACDSPSKYVVDPRGAVQTSSSYANTFSTFTTGNTDESCVVQVWVTKSQ